MAQNPQDTVLKQRVDVKRKEAEELREQLVGLQATEADLRTKAEDQRAHVEGLVAKLREASQAIKAVRP